MLSPSWQSQLSLALFQENESHIVLLLGSQLSGPVLSSHKLKATLLFFQVVMSRSQQSCLQQGWQHATQLPSHAISYTCLLFACTT